DLIVTGVQTCALPISQVAMNLKALEQDTGPHSNVKLDRIPVSLAGILTNDIYSSALFHPSKESGSKVNVLEEVAGNSRQPLSLGIDQHGTGHGVKDPLVDIVRSEVRTGIEPEADKTSRSPQSLKAKAP